MLRPSGSPGILLRSMVWRNLVTYGSDYCCLWQIGRSWLLQGTAIAVLKDGRPMLADYEIECDQLWHTRRARRYASQVLRRVRLILRSRLLACGAVREK